MLSRENLVLTMLAALVALTCANLFIGAGPEKSAYAAGASGSSRFAVAVAGIEGSSAEIVYLFDETTRHLVTYHQPSRAQGRKLDLLSIRSIEYDFLPIKHNVSRPYPEDIKKEAEKYR